MPLSATQLCNVVVQQGLRDGEGEGVHHAPEEIINPFGVETLGRLGDAAETSLRGCTPMWHVGQSCVVAMRRVK